MTLLETCACSLWLHGAGLPSIFASSVVFMGWRWAVRWHVFFFGPVVLRCIPCCLGHGRLRVSGHWARLDRSRPRVCLCEVAGQSAMVRLEVEMAWPLEWH
eukprot:5278628-Alexandrium_andersonii.AAC.1